MIELLHRILPHSEMAEFVGVTVVRLIVAAILGGIVGIERETKHKPAGLRTNMFICVGSAFFTILSERLAGQFVGDHTRIAAQIIPGIGFIGAGSILHSRGGVTGLTTAATLFVVASIGMGVGGGLYAPSIFATIVIFVALHFLGYFETWFNLKAVAMCYEVTGDNAEEILARVNEVLEDERRIMQSVQVGRSNSNYRVQFTIESTNLEHQDLLKRLRQIPELGRVESLGESKSNE